MDNQHDISCSEDPLVIVWERALELKDIGISCKLVSISPVTNDSHWEVASGHNHVSSEDPSPHGDFGRHSGLWGKRGLNLQNHVVSCIRKCYHPQRIENTQYLMCCMGICRCRRLRPGCWTNFTVIWQMVVLSLVISLVYGYGPRNCWVAAQMKTRSCPVHKVFFPVLRKLQRNGYLSTNSWLADLHLGCLPNHIRRNNPSKLAILLCATDRDILGNLYICVGAASGANINWVIECKLIPDLTDMMAAAKEIAAIEFKFGRWTSSKCTEP